MPISVGEYLGQRTDVDIPKIIPQSLNPAKDVICPFMGQRCSKIHRKEPQQPVCTIRQNEKIWVVCTHRVLPAKKGALTASYLSFLGAVAQELFPKADMDDVGYKNQASIATSGSKRVALDYVLTVKGPYEHGKKQAILEVQVGGESSSTGNITNHVAKWAATRPHTNKFLRSPIPKTGIIPNNAWKRQLEQILRKSSIAKRFDGAFALAVGEILYDYISPMFPAQYPYIPNWEVAIVCIAEKKNLEPNAGAIPIDRVRETIFLTHEQFVEAVASPPLPDNLSSPFVGEFTTMGNESFTVD